MDDYKPNSHRYKERQAEEKTAEHRAEKVVTGGVKQRKKSGLSRAGSVFMPGDVDSVKNYILMDVLVPSIKRAISDIICNGINMLLGEPTRSKPSAQGAKVSYRSYYEQNDRRDYARPGRRPPTAMTTLYLTTAATRKRCSAGWRSCWNGLKWSAWPICSIWRASAATIRTTNTAGRICGTRGLRA